jgi:hypothetical protein
VDFHRHSYRLALWIDLPLGDASLDVWAAEEEVDLSTGCTTVDLDPKFSWQHSA